MNDNENDKIILLIKSIDLNIQRDTKYPGTKITKIIPDTRLINPKVSEK